MKFFFPVILLILAQCHLAAFEPNEVEIEIAALAADHPDQARSEWIYDPILSEVARNRALDMATRAYFSHTNPDGLGPNRLVQLEGYGLPDFWGTEDSNNFIESISAGYLDASSAWRGWLDSPPHRAHVIAGDSFYSDQTHYGIGYASRFRAPPTQDTTFSSPLLPILPLLFSPALILPLPLSTLPLTLSLSTLPSSPLPLPIPLLWTSGKSLLTY